MAHDPGREVTWGRTVGEGAPLSLSLLAAAGIPFDSPPLTPIPAGASSFASMLVGAVARAGWIFVGLEEADTDTSEIET